MAMINACDLPPRREPLSYEEMMMIIKTGYGPRLTNAAEAQREIQAGCVGNSLAVPFGLAHLIGILEREGTITTHDPNPIPESNAPNSVIESALRRLFDLDLQTKLQGLRDLKGALTGYNEHDLGIIRQRFTDGLLDYMKFHGYGQYAIVLVRVQQNYRDQDMLDGSYGGLGRTQIDNIPPQRFWNRYLINRRIGDDESSQDAAKRALSGLLIIYQEMSLSPLQGN